jgi:DNA-directed RNA polymerase specialized sigma subunit
MKNPIEEYEESKEAAQTKRKADEISLWQRWKDSGEQATHLQPLLKLYEPVIAQKVRAWKPPNVPESAFKAELQTHTIKAFQTYDPSRGAALNTHVEARLPKAMRYGNRGANVAYIPEEQARQIGRLRKAQDELSEELGRDPTHSEIADHIGMPMKRVTTILKAVRKDIPMGRSGGEDYDYTGGAERAGHGFEEQQIALASTILPQIFPNKPHHVAIFNHVFGTNDHTQIASTGELAKKLNISQSQVSRMKTQVGETLRKYMGLDKD